MRVGDDICGENGEVSLLHYFAVKSFIFKEVRRAF